MNVYLDVQRSIQSEDQQASSSYDILNNPELYRLMIDFKIIIQHWKSDFSNFFMKHGPSPAISKASDRNYFVQNETFSWFYFIN